MAGAQDVASLWTIEKALKISGGGTERCLRRCSRQRVYDAEPARPSRHIPIHPEVEYYAGTGDHGEGIGENVHGILSKEADYRYILKEVGGSCAAYLSSPLHPLFSGLGDFLEQCIMCPDKKSAAAPSEVPLPRLRWGLGKTDGARKDSEGN